MRPVKLTMSAFGPYSAVAQADMERLGKQGVYLITGNTGAGKTTIFDAIKFALFGEPSGAVREPFMLRSKYADDSIATYVELEFEYDQKRYRIKRNPAYRRKKARGEGETEQKADASLVLPDGRVIAGFKVVTEAVTALMGIDARQFSQIMMIAQGQFKDLLLAPTEKRGEVFREIFNTGQYVRLQQRVKEQANELERLYTEKGRHLLQHLKRAQGVPEHPLTSVLNQQQETEAIAALPEILALLGQLTKADEDEKERLEVWIGQQEQHLSQINQTIGKAMTQEHLARELEAAKAVLAAESVNEEVLRQRLERLNEKQGEKNRLAVEIELLTARLAEYDERQQCSQRRKELTGELNGRQAEQKALEEQLVDIRNRIEAIREQQQLLQEADAKLLKLEYEADQNSSKMEQLEQLNESYSRYVQVKMELDNTHAKWNNSIEYKNQVSGEYMAMENRFLAEQAGILAGRLAPGLKCPVCGSPHHPEPAVLTNDGPNRQALEQLRKKQEHAVKIAEQISNAASLLSGQESARRESLQQLAGQLLGTTETADIKVRLKEFSNQIQNQEQSIKRQISELKDQLEVRRRLEQELPQRQHQQEHLQAAAKVCQEELLLLQNRLASEAEKLREMNEKLEYPSKELACRQIEDLKNKKDRLDRNYQETQEYYQNCLQKISRCQATIETCEKQLEHQNPIDLEAFQGEREKTEQQKLQLGRQKETIQSRLQLNRDVISSLVREDAEIEKIRDQLQWIKALSDTFNGKMKGKEKVELETYVQTMYFDRILNRANLRLMIITNGQFEFERRKEAENRTMKSGLELDVLDHYNGSRRSVKTLSGGESFKASLALALGLSDEIQSTAGGIKLETLFIDEGFGSLDEESLDQAMNILGELSEGNKLVGIISHVAELKDRIDKQVQVIKHKEGGSSLRIVR